MEQLQQGYVVGSAGQLIDRFGSVFEYPDSSVELMSAEAILEQQLCALELIVAATKLVDSGKIPADVVLNIMGIHC